MQPTRDTTETPTTRDDRDRPRRWAWAVGLLAAAAVGVGLFLTQPWLLFVDTVADETLPVTIATTDAPVPATGTAGPTEAADDGATDDGAADDGAVADATAAPAPTPTPDPGPVVLLQGSFVSRDHTTTGAVAVVELADGSRVLTIEDLDTDNGPDLFVYLDDDGADAPEGHFDDGLSLGRLRANQGDLVYEIPAGVDLDSVASVGIWCDRFSSLFGAADLAPAA